GRTMPLTRAASVAFEIIWSVSRPGLTSSGTTPEYSAVRRSTSGCGLAATTGIGCRALLQRSAVVPDSVKAMINLAWISAAVAAAAWASALPTSPGSLQLHPQVAASDHHRVRHREDLAELPDRLQLLELGDDGDLAAEVLLASDHVLGPPHKREREVINLELDGQLQVGQVLFRERGQGQGAAGDAHALALAQQPAPHHRSLGLAIRHSTDSQLDPAVVEQHPIPRPQGLDELLRADVDLVGFQFHLRTLWGGRAGGPGGR